MLALVVGSLVAVRALWHRSDVPAFQAYVQTYIGGNLPDGPDDAAWARAHPDQVLAEANRSCDWLARQPLAPMRIDPTGYYARDGLQDRYLAATADDRLAEVSLGGRSLIVAGAWTYLCAQTVVGRVAPRHAHVD